MEQFMAFVEKANSDSVLSAKLEALETENPDVNGVIALAAEHGFTITEDDYRRAANAVKTQKKGKLSEDDLDAVSGGATANRYDPAECGKHSRAHYNCVGFLSLCWCDHYRESKNNAESNDFQSVYDVYCTMGYFSYQNITYYSPGEA